MKLKMILLSINIMLNYEPPTSNVENELMVRERIHTCIPATHDSVRGDNEWVHEHVT
jgi:hypothetical protein